MIWYVRNRTTGATYWTDSKTAYEKICVLWGHEYFAAPMTQSVDSDDWQVQDGDKLVTLTGRQIAERQYGIAWKPFMPAAPEPVTENTGVTLDELLTETA